LAAGAGAALSVAALAAGAGAALPWAALGAAFLAMVVGTLQRGVDGLDRVLRARPRRQPGTRPGRGPLRG
jgi:hypothetical protein